MTKHTSLPGYTLAQRIMKEATHVRDELFNDVLADCNLDDPLTNALPARPSPDSCLDALMILRLMSSHAAAGRQSMLPDPGAATLILVPGFDDLKRLQPLIEKLNSELMISGKTKPPHFGDLEIIAQPRAGAAAYEMRRFNENIRDGALRGKPVMVIAVSARAVEPDIQSVVSAKLQVGPATSAMLHAILKLLFPKSRQKNPEFDFSGLGELHLARIFAADTAAAARKVVQSFKPEMAQRNSTPSVTLEDVHGQLEAKAAFAQLIADLDAWKSGDLPWGEVISSFLLKGPPGTGKTLLAQAFASSAGLPLVHTSYSDCQRAGHQGDMLRELNDAVQKAISSTPAVLFIDEIDSFYARNASGNFSGYIMGVVNGLLVEIDRVNATPGVVLIAASNFADRVDPAILRPGRLDQHLYVGPFDRAGIRSMIAAQIPGILGPDEVEKLADQLFGQTGASVAALLRDARTRARRAREQLCARIIFEAARTVAPVPDPDLLRRIALHEAGHVVVGLLSEMAAPTAVRVERGGGQVRWPAVALHTRATALNHLRMLLAGRAAEEVFLGAPSSGAGVGPESDLALATQLAKFVELQWGMGDGGLIWHPAAPEAMQNLPWLRTKLDHLLTNAEAQARAIIATHRNTVDALAAELLQAGEITGHTLERWVIKIRNSARPTSAQTNSAVVVIPIEPR